jgi:DNA-binding response OmpR family regulator
MNAKPRLLFVDDEEDLRTVVQHQLTEEGFAVDTADDGDTAIAALREKLYDLILLDIRMPRVNGIEVLKYVKKAQLSSRIIMLTAVDDLSTALEAVRIGANDYVTKPYNLNDLVSSIRKMIST